MSGIETSNYDNINLAKEQAEWVAEKIDIADITELLKTSGWTELLKNSFDADFESKQSLSDISKSIMDSLDLNNLSLTRWSSDVFALQIIGHISDKSITIDGIVWNQTRWVIEKLKLEVWIDIAKANKTIEKNKKSIIKNNEKIWNINTKIGKLDKDRLSVDSKIKELDVKIWYNKKSIDAFNNSNPNLASKITENNSSLKIENDNLNKLNKTENIWIVMQDIFKWGELNWEDLDNVNKLMSSKDKLKDDFPKTHDRLLQISNMLFDSILEK